jgi:hypothetical protein
VPSRLGLMGLFLNGLARRSRLHSVELRLSAGPSG